MKNPCDFILCWRQNLKARAGGPSKVRKMLTGRALATCARRVLIPGAILITGVRLAGIYAPFEASLVPVDRLVANLERDLAADPKNATTHTNLGRLHGMAYALKTEEVPAGGFKPEDKEKPFFGPNPTLIPYRVKPAPDPPAEARAKEHLAKAIQHYEAALAIDPKSLQARLGYGWMLDQAGDDARAIDEYRRVIEQAWPAEQKVKAVMPSQRFYTQETAEYLIPLLDPAKDAAEIQDLRAKRDQLVRLPRAITPIAIPLDDRTVSPHQILDPLARVRFDADGSGLRREWTWITRDAGWLVYDVRGKGEITSALQWFGNVTFWLFWNNGYDAMRALDDDGDGELAGSELTHLALWHDRNLDGVSDSSEVRPLASHGIVGVSCRYVDGDGIRLAAFSIDGVRLADGRTRPTYDFILRQLTSTLTRK
jgi:tetratricopeptide (TPR) repeat protein